MPEPRPPRPSPRSRIVRSVLLALATAVAACSRPPAPAPAQAAASAVPVLLARARVAPVQRDAEAVGTLWGDEDTTIAAKVSGRIVDIRVDFGDRVAAGDVLAQIDATDYALAVRQRELAVRESLAKIALRELPGPDYDPVQVPPGQRASLLAKNAQGKFTPTKQLYEQVP